MSFSDIHVVCCRYANENDYYPCNPVPISSLSLRLSAYLGVCPLSVVDKQLPGREAQRGTAQAPGRGTQADPRRGEGAHGRRTSGDERGSHGRGEGKHGCYAHPHFHPCGIVLRLVERVWCNWFVPMHVSIFTALSRDRSVAQKT